MQNNYIYYYIFNSEFQNYFQEAIIDFNEIDAESEVMDLLPEFSPDDSVLEKIFELL